jgi:hypothetical protein
MPLRHRGDGEGVAPIPAAADKIVIGRAAVHFAEHAPFSLKSTVQLAEPVIVQRQAIGGHGIDAFISRVGVRQR